MKKQRLLSLFLLFIFTIVSLCMFTACKKKVTYKLHSYTLYSSIYNLGDTFYSIELNKDLVQLTLDDNELELIISQSFISGNASKAGQFVLYTGTYTETESMITAIIPNFSTSTLIVHKTGEFFTLQLSSYSTITLKQDSSSYHF